MVVTKRVGPDGEKKWRLVVDFRHLNEKAIGDAHPLPDITEILDQLGQSKYFTCLDMVMGYHQIKLEKGKGPKRPLAPSRGIGIQETSLWAKNSACYFPNINELCIERINWDALFCLLRRYFDTC
jgi:hypothetical protein